MVGLFTTKIQRRPPPPLRPASFRDFSGGWDAVDSDISMSSKFAVTANNMMIGTDGSIGLRPGSKLFVDVGGAVAGNILNMYYFQDLIIAVTDAGEVAKVSSNGTVTAIWNHILAGAAGMWSSGLKQANFVPFKSQLAIHNGVDKPLWLDKNAIVKYLQDPATGSNVNVPVGAFGCTVSNYHVIAGIPQLPTQISISSSGTIGTFTGDPAPNDAVNIDVGAYTSLAAPDIRGIAGYRNFLLVFFRDSAVIITLGNYKADGDNQVHTPLYNDTMPKFGLLGQRGIIYLENDLFFMAPHGLASAKRNIFAGIIESKTLSEIIKPAYNALSRSMSEDDEKYTSFAVRDPLGDRVYMSMKGNGLAYTFNDELRVKGWSQVSGWPWKCACESRQGRVFGALGSKIYQLGNAVLPGEEFYGDRVGDWDQAFYAGTTYHVGDRIKDTATPRIFQAQSTVTTVAGDVLVDLANQHPDQWVEYFGDPTTFEWEMPWSDFQDSERVKHIRTVKIKSDGFASFNLAVYVDYLYRDKNGVEIHDPAVAMDFRAGATHGFGAAISNYRTVVDEPFGSGRDTSDPRLYKLPVRFKIMKTRVRGSATAKIRFMGLTFLYTKGTFQRP